MVRRSQRYLVYRPARTMERLKRQRYRHQYASFCGTECPLPVIEGAGILFAAVFDPRRYAITGGIMGATIIRSGLGRTGVFSGTGFKELPH